MKEPLRQSQLQLETAALWWFAFFFFGCPQSLPFLRCFVFALERERLSHSTKHFTPVLFGPANF